MASNKVAFIRSHFTVYLLAGLASLLSVSYFIIGFAVIETCVLKVRYIICFTLFTLLLSTVCVIASIKRTAKKFPLVTAVLILVFLVVNLCYMKSVSISFGDYAKKMSKKHKTDVEKSVKLDRLKDTGHCYYTLGSLRTTTYWAQVMLFLLSLFMLLITYESRLSGKRTHQEHSESRNSIDDFIDNMETHNRKDHTKTMQLKAVKDEHTSTAGSDSTSEEEAKIRQTFERKIVKKRQYVRK